MCYSALTGKAEIKQLIDQHATQRPSEWEQELFAQRKLVTKAAYAACLERESTAL